MISKDIDILQIQEKAIIFDCFGTLLNIKNKKNPYVGLLKKYKLLTKENLKLILKEKIYLEDFQYVFNIDLKDIESTKKELHFELKSIKPFDNVLNTISQLKRQNKKLLICSNLSADYISSLTMLPIEEKVLSCEVGFIKPEYEMYEMCIDKLGLSAKDICFIGDNRINDYETPRKLGMNSILIQQVFPNMSKKNKP